MLPVGATVLGVGIDAPLFWGRGGNRQVDDMVRNAVAAKEHRYASGTVQQVNALRGAAVVQGPLLAAILHREFPSARITEAHPKALIWLLGRKPLEGLLLSTGQKAPAKPNEDERDAYIAAVAAWKMLTTAPGWRDLYRDEPNPVQPFGTPVSYWMPL